MGDKLTVEAPGRSKPLISLPRAQIRDEHGAVEPPDVTIDVEFGKKAPAGCVACNRPITPETSRIVIRLRLRKPVDLGNGRRRLTEKYFAHPGCLTDRVRPEVIRSRMDCYDCGAIPEQPERRDDGFHVGLIYWANRCFTVSKFAAAPLCHTCSEKPRWKECDACGVYFPHWMVSEVVGKAEVAAKHLSQYAMLEVREHDNVCEYCAKRLHIPTTVQVESDRESFERLRREIAEHGIFEAGDHE